MIIQASKVMNAAVNFYTHACEGCTEADLAERTRQRQQNRGVPYLFLKPTRGAIIGTGDDILMPFGRDEIEYEVEMAIVFGRSGKYVSAARAYDHVFGYMVSMDISDRGGRPPVDDRAVLGGFHRQEADSGGQRGCGRRQCCGWFQEVLVGQALGEVLDGLSLAGQGFEVRDRLDGPDRYSTATIL